MKEYGGVVVLIHIFLNSPLVGGEYKLCNIEKYIHRTIILSYLTLSVALDLSKIARSFGSRTYFLHQERWRLTRV
jgi:hypothetical protein